LAKRIFNTNLTWATQALNVAVTGANSMNIQGISTTQVIDWDEVLISGQDSASVIGNFLVVPMSTMGATFTALAAPNSDGPMQSGATPVVQNTYIAATTEPVPSNAVTAPHINLGLNTFGGIIRWNAAPTQQFTTVGSAVFAAGPPTTFGGAILLNNSTTGASAKAVAHIIYEPY